MPDSDGRQIARWRLIVAANTIALLSVAVWFRCLSLENIPGVNADEAWYGTKAMEWRENGLLSLRTPTGNPPNPFFFGPVALLHAFFPPSIRLLRSVSVGSGLAALAVNWWLCRWVFDRRTAWISTVMLAVLPINIAYSRFAWDASQSVLATLPVFYFSLAAVRFRRRKICWLAIAVAAEVVAVLVHPTNLFAAVAIVAAVAMDRPWWSESSTGEGRTVNTKFLIATLFGAIVMAGYAIYVIRTPGSSRFVARLTDLRHLTEWTTITQYLSLYPRLFTGSTIFAYIAGSRSWYQWPHGYWLEGLGIDAAMFWIVIVPAAALVWTSWKENRRREDCLLLWVWGLQLAAFALVAGPEALTPGWDRYAMCLIGPGVLLFARGATLWSATASSRRRKVFAAAALAVAWLVLIDYHQHYFRFIERTGGQSHMAFRTAAIEPKLAALRMIERHEKTGPVWIVTDQWWNRRPLEYLAKGSGKVTVLTHKEAAESPELIARAMDRGRVWFVKFSCDEALQEVRVALTGREVDEQQINDYSGRPVLTVLHPRGVE